MSEQEIIEAFLYPGDKGRVLSLLPVVKDPAGIRDNNNDRTLLHFAADNGWTDVCRLLVEQYQVDPHCRDSGGWTALHCASLRGWTDVCRLLVEQYQVDPYCSTNDGYTALHCACIDDHLDVVQYLVSNIYCDPLTKDNDGHTPLSDSKGETRIFLRRIIESSMKAGYTNVVDYLKQSREKVIDEAVAEAMAEGEGELFQCNLVFHGPPGSGKSSTKEAVLGEPPRPKHKQNATDILEKSVRTVCITDDDQLVQVSNDDMIGMLAGEVDILLENKKPDDQHLCKSDNPSSSVNTTGESLAVSLEETSDSTSVAKVPSSTDEAIQEPSKYNRPLNTKTEELLKQRLLDPSRKRHRYRRVFNSRWLHHIDSGGQLQYLDTFPMMHRSPSHFVLTMNVTEGLDERPKVRFYNQGKDEYLLPDRLVLTNREMIIRMCQIAQRIAQDTGGKFVPRVFVVGTHKDKLFPIFGRRHLKAVNSELLRIHEKYSDVLVCKVPGEQVMFAINAMAEGKERQQYTEELQKHILAAATKNTGEPVKVPFNWLMFHLELDQGDGVVRMSECRRLGGKMRMNKEKVGIALGFLNKAALVQYYPEDVPDLVLTKMDPFTSRLSRLIKASFLPPDEGPTKESEELRNKGVFKRTFLKRVFADLEESLLSEEEFLKLLESLRIAVNIGREEYFLPSALSLEPTPKQSSFKSESIPLSLSWGGLILPHGLFPTVCVELLVGREGGYVFELRRDIDQRREEIQLSEEKGKIPGVVKLSDRQRWIEVSYSGDNNYCPTVIGIVDGATKRAIARLRHMGIRSPTIGCVCPFCIAKDHYCYLSEDRHFVTCSIIRSKTGPVTADILCWFEDSFVEDLSKFSQASLSEGESGYSSEECEPDFKVLKSVSTTTESFADTGLSMKYSDGSSPPYTVAVVTCDQFTLPDQYVPVSAVYKISLTGALSKPIRIEMQHCVDVKDEKCSKRMSFALASYSSTEFKLIPKGEFPVAEGYGYIEPRDQSCCLSIVLKLIDYICNDVRYFCLYYWKSNERMRIVVGKDLDVLKNRSYIGTEMDSFTFKFVDADMEFGLDDQKTELANGWSIRTSYFPFKISQVKADLFGYNSSRPFKCEMKVTLNVSPPTDLDHKITIYGIKSTKNAVIHVRKLVSDTAESEGSSVQTITEKVTDDTAPLVSSATAEYVVLKLISPTDTLIDTGLSMKYSDGSSPPCTVAVVTCNQFTLPDQYVPVSAVYKISLTGAPSKLIKVKMQHCVDVKDEEVSKRMSFALASHSSAEFQIIPGGEFPVGERYGYIERKSFCFLSSVMEKVFDIQKYAVHLWNVWYFCLYFWKSSEMHIIVGRNLKVLKDYCADKFGEEADSFGFKFSDSCMELDLKERKTDLDNRWSIKAFSFPCKISQKQANLFGYKSDIPAGCKLLITSADPARPPVIDLDHHIPINGITDSDKTDIYVHRSISDSKHQSSAASPQGNSVGINTPLDLQTVFGLLRSKSSKWNAIGRELGVSNDYREGLEMEKRSNEDKLEKVLNKWIESQCSDVTWDHLIKVLEEDLENKAPADKIRQHLDKMKS